MNIAKDATELVAKLHHANGHCTMVAGTRREASLKRRPLAAADFHQISCTRYPCPATSLPSVHVLAACCGHLLRSAGRSLHAGSADKAAEGAEGGPGTANAAVHHENALSSCMSRTLLPLPCASRLQTKPEKAHLARSGLDLINGAIRNNVEAGVLEPALSKTKITQGGRGEEERAARLWQPSGVQLLLCAPDLGRKVPVVWRESSRAPASAAGVL